MAIEDGFWLERELTEHCTSGDREVAAESLKPEAKKSKKASKEVQCYFSYSMPPCASATGQSREGRQ